MANARHIGLGILALGVLVGLLSLGLQMMNSRLDAGSRAAIPSEQSKARTGSGTAKLSWARLDPVVHGGSDGKDPVAGFRVYAGPAPDRLALEATIPDHRATGYVVKELPRGTHYFTVTTYSRNGIESERPQPVAKDVR